MIGEDRAAPEVKGLSTTRREVKVFQNCRRFRKWPGGIGTRRVKSRTTSGDEMGTMTTVSGSRLWKRELEQVEQASLLRG